MTDTERRLAYWREKLPLDPIVTEVRCRRVMFLRAEWVRTHPLGNALSDWPKAEHEHFAAVGRLLEKYSSWTVALGDGPTTEGGDD